MINSFIGLSWRLLWKNKGIIISMIVSIILSVSLIITLFAFVESAKLTLDDESTVLNIKQLTQYIFVLSMILLMLTSYLISSNFEIFKHHYQRQLAIMRTIGARKNHIFKIIWSMTLFINLIGTIVGWTLAWLIYSYSNDWIANLFKLTLPEGAFNYKMSFIMLVGCFIVLQIFMLFPAYKHAQILPLSAMKETYTPSHLNNQSSKIGKVLLGISVICLLFYVVFSNVSSGSNVILLFISVITGVLGLIRLCMIFIPKLIVAILPALQKVFGQSSYIGVKNASRQVKTNFIILSITSIMMVAICGSSIIETVSSTGKDHYKRIYPTPVVLTFQESDRSHTDRTEIIKKLNGMDELDRVSVISAYYSEYIKTKKGYATMDYVAADFEGLNSQGLITVKQDAELKQQVIVSSRFARQYKLEVGHWMDLGKYNFSLQSKVPWGKVQVLQIVDELPGVYTDVMFDWNNELIEQFAHPVSKAFITASNTEGLIKRLEQMKSSYTGIEINVYSKVLHKHNAATEQIRSIFIIVVIAMMVSALIGIINSLMNNMRSKRKELAVLRAIALSPNKIIRVIMTQVTMYLWLGLSIGVVMGGYITVMLALMDREATIKVNFSFLAIAIASILLIVMSIMRMYASKMSRKELVHELKEDQ